MTNLDKCKIKYLGIEYKTDYFVNFIFFLQRSQKRSSIGSYPKNSESISVTLSGPWIEYECEYCEVEDLGVNGRDRSIYL